ncbi:AtpZ/AtpI family protein [Fodinisporobacter ferrooxydans]|uniref:AtpZ/AtpI family protein n=1 Tax=Fodinisporobacter ferrooxydans TaxID=2901836 RepID=A0ABY4CM63_9BACL|nr:AtpZ/AtpI family protein [Alicyclobacillaceae bacterium MYW30-H2]
MKQGGGGSPWRAFVLVHGVGIQLVASILIGLYGGRFFDRHFHTSPWLTIVGLVIGTSGGIFAAVKLVKAFLGDRR